MFNNLSDKFQDIFKKIKGSGKLSEENIKDALREVRLSLLEADVNYGVVRKFIASVKEKSIGESVLKGINPGQQFIKILNDSLVEMLGGEDAKLIKSTTPPTVIMLAGLQGAGKTTFSAKLSKYLKKKGSRPLLIAADIYRPAAIKQLHVLGDSIDVPVFSIESSKNVIEIYKKGYEKAIAENLNTIIIDTAGRLHIDEKLMKELVDLKAIAKPDETLFVVDSMTGQDAVNVAKEFNLQLEVTGIVLTKLDGDTRGGAALSIKSVVGKPIKFIGIGEKLDDIELFHPDRLASRILGMGDIVSFVEKAQEVMDEDEMKRLEAKMKKQTFDLDDFLNQLQQIKKMGPLGSIMKMIPGMPKIDDFAPAEKEMKRVEAMIRSMTNDERHDPKILNASRKRRISKGSGTNVQSLNKLLKQFDQMKKMMKMFGGGKGKMPGLGALKGLKMPF